MAPVPPNMLLVIEGPGGKVLLAVEFLGEIRNEFEEEVEMFESSLKAARMANGPAPRRSLGEFAGVGASKTWWISPLLSKEVFVIDINGLLPVPSVLAL